VPKGVKKVIRSETEFVFAVHRAQLFNLSHIDNVKMVQTLYKAQTLSAFLGTTAPKATPSIDFIKPLTSEAEKSSPQFFNILSFVLEFCPTDPSETELMARFAKIGVGAGKTMDASKLTPEMKAAIEGGVADAWADFAGLVKQLDAGKVTPEDVFGTREYLKKDYLYRMGAAVMGIYENSKQEAMYQVYGMDEVKQKLNGANRHSLRFEPGEFPPVNVFWSLTILLAANPMNRYLLNSPTLPQFKLDPEGGLPLNNAAPKVRQILL
jgi:hypothetical protein